MGADLTADDLSPAKLAEAVRLLTGAVRDWSASDTEIRAALLVDDLMDQGWRLTPPPQPGTVTELDLIVFLEWLDSTRQVTEWGDPSATHEDTAREYLAQAAPSGNVTVNVDDLATWLEESEPGFLHHKPGEPCRSCDARGSLVTALAEADRDR